MPALSHLLYYVMGGPWTETGRGYLSAVIDNRFIISLFFISK